MILKDIKNYEGIYFASSCGEILSLKSGKLTVLKGGLCATGYRSYSLRKNGVQTQMLGHRLIANAFIDNFENKEQVNHKDGNKLNNSVDNLEWVNRSENMQHAVAKKLTTISDSHLKMMQKNAGKAKALFTEIDAKNIRAIYNLMNFPSCRKIAKAYGCSKTTIQRIINGTQLF